MTFFTVRDLRTQPRQIWEKLSEVNEIIITNNGKPSALMIRINDDDMDDVIASVRQAAAMRAVNKLRIDSVLSGRSKIGDDEIDAEITQTRKERT